MLSTVASALDVPSSRLNESQPVRIFLSNRAGFFGSDARRTQSSSRAQAIVPPSPGGSSSSTPQGDLSRLDSIRTHFKLVFLQQDERFNRVSSGNTLFLSFRRCLTQRLCLSLEKSNRLMRRWPSWKRVLTTRTCSRSARSLEARIALAHLSRTLRKPRSSRSSSTFILARPSLEMASTTSRCERSYSSAESADLCLAICAWRVC